MPWRKRKDVGESTNGIVTGCECRDGFSAQCSFPPKCGYRSNALNILSPIACREWRAGSRPRISLFLATHQCNGKPRYQTQEM